MKSLFFLSALFIACSLFSCNNDAGTTSTTATTGTNNNQQQTLEANRQIYRAIETGDSATLQKYISEDAVDHGGGPEGQDLRGREIITMLTSVHRDIDNLKFNVEQMAANNDYVFALVRMTGTTNKPVWGMPANHSIDSRSVDVLRMQNGKVVEHWGFADAGEIMRMMQNNTNAPGQGAGRADTSRNPGTGRR